MIIGAFFKFFLISWEIVWPILLLTTVSLWTTARSFKTLSVLDKILNSIEVRDLAFKIKKFLDHIKEVEEEEHELEIVDETQYEELDSRLQVIEVFFDSVQSIGKSKKKLS